MLEYRYGETHKNFIFYKGYLFGQSFGEYPLPFFRDVPRGTMTVKCNICGMEFTKGIQVSRLQGVRDDWQALDSHYNANHFMEYREIKMGLKKDYDDKIEALEFEYFS